MRLGLYQAEKAVKESGEGKSGNKETRDIVRNGKK